MNLKLALPALATVVLAAVLLAGVMLVGLSAPDNDNASKNTSPPAESETTNINGNGTTVLPPGDPAVPPANASAFIPKDIAYVIIIAPGRAARVEAADAQVAARFSSLDWSLDANASALVSRQPFVEIDRSVYAFNPRAPIQGTTAWQLKPSTPYYSPMANGSRLVFWLQSVTSHNGQTIGEIKYRVE